MLCRVELPTPSKTFIAEFFCALGFYNTRVYWKTVKVDSQRGFFFLSEQERLSISLKKALFYHTPVVMKMEERLS